MFVFITLFAACTVWVAWFSWWHFSKPEPKHTHEPEVVAKPVYHDAYNEELRRMYDIDDKIRNYLDSQRVTGTPLQLPALPQLPALQLPKLPSLQLPQLSFQLPGLPSVHVNTNPDVYEELMRMALLAAELQVHESLTAAEALPPVDVQAEGERFEAAADSLEQDE